MTIFTHDELGLVELVSEKAKGKSVVRTEDGLEHKVWPKDLTEVELTDDDGEPKRGGDVFPAGVRDSYERGKTADGAVYIDSGDELAVKLRGAELPEVAALAAKLCGQRSAQGWLDLYTADREADGKAALNAGMVRMNLGNRIRAAVKKAAAAAE